MEISPCVSRRLKKQSHITGSDIQGRHADNETDNSDTDRADNMPELKPLCQRHLLQFDPDPFMRPAGAYLLLVPVRAPGHAQREHAGEEPGR